MIDSEKILLFWENATDIFRENENNLSACFYLFLAVSKIDNACRFYAEFVANIYSTSCQRSPISHSAYLCSRHACNPCAALSHGEATQAILRAQANSCSDVSLLQKANKVIDAISKRVCFHRLCSALAFFTLSCKSSYDDLFSTVSASADDDPFIYGPCDYSYSKKLDQAASQCA